MNADLQAMKRYYSEKKRIPHGLITDDDGNPLTSEQAHKLIDWGIANGYKDLYSMPDYKEIANELHNKEVMKTPEEKAREFRKELEVRFIEDISEKNKIEVAFLAGYQEANRWRNVEDELPEVNTDNEFDLKYGYSKSVLVKGITGRYLIANYIHNGKSWNIQGSSYTRKITHWRPIE